MNKGWRTRARQAIREYPKLRTEANLSDTQQIDLRAVTMALKALQRYRTTDLRLRIVDICYWQSNLTVDGAAAVLHVSPETAHLWDRDFISLVDAYRRLLEKKSRE